MIKLFKRIVLLALVSVFVLPVILETYLITPVAAHPTVIRVPDDYEKIQWAVGNASAGDTILVAAGTYYEHIIVNKAASLIGEDESTTIIDGSNHNTVVYVTANNVTISGFTIQNGFNGIYLYYSMGNNILGNTIKTNWYGIFIEFSDGNNINANAVINNLADGISLKSSSSNNINENLITNNDYGICIESSNTNNLSGNTLTKNWRGIHLVDSDGTIISRNIITNNDYGIYLSRSHGNSIYHNNFINNTINGRGKESANVWDDGYPSGGNYWGDYTGVDLYGGPYQNETGSDGIGDTPYMIYGEWLDGMERYYAKDIYPLMKPWGAPIGIFTYSPEGPHIGETITFNASVSYDLDGYIVSYEWNFGDVNITTVPTPIIVHAYTKDDTYNVILTVTDNHGLSDSTTKSITIQKAAPINIVPYVVTGVAMIITVSILLYFIRTRKRQSPPHR